MNYKDYEKFMVSNGVSSNKLDSYHKFTNNIIEPYILEERTLNVAPMSVFSRLLYDGIIFLGGPINDDVANIINSQLMYLNSVDDGRDVKLFINSPGGQVSSGLAIYDVMNWITPDVATYCMGTCASMGAVLLSSGAQGKRFSLPHSEIMIHQPSGGTGVVKSDDMEIAWQQMSKCKNTLNSILAANTGKTVEEIEEACKLDKWFTANEAMDYGLIDNIINKR